MFSLSMRSTSATPMPTRAAARIVLIDGSARLGVERLAVGDAFGEAGRVQHHRGGDHRSRQRPTARFVDPGDGPAVQLELDGLQLESRLHGRESLFPLGELRGIVWPLSKQGQLSALGDGALEQVGAQLGVALVEP